MEQPKETVVPEIDPKPFVMNIDTAEIDLIKKTFKDEKGDDILLKAMRALLLGLKVEKHEKEMIRAAFSDEALFRAVSKRLLPTLDRDANIGQVSDSWLGVETMIFGMPRDAIEQAIGYKERAIDMTKEALKLLKDPDREQISLIYSPKTTIEDPLQINLLARNQYIRHIEAQLLFLKLIASRVDGEKPKDIEKRRIKDSAR